MVGPMAALEDEHPVLGPAPPRRPRRRVAVVGRGDGRVHRRGLPDAWMTDGDLGRVACPVLVSHGDADRFFDVAHALALYRAIPDSRLWVIPGLDHPIQGVEVEDFAARVGAFLMG